ncbi:hypothetical protein LR48_Vigan04g161200 [Vigna angularis]|uniref:Uncharacterized protein n=1 Tax=Phaseolus angularis TaxID=3914 RepID=A0A0L9UFT6_PHAAN|nr:hypothetical protein LR48_Vigan04g161200 [Vigna angularis]
MVTWASGPFGGPMTWTSVLYGVRSLLTREPRKRKAFLVGALSPADLEVVRTINALPRRISARHLVECLSLEDCGQKAFDLMMTPAPRQSNYMASRKRGGASSSLARPKVAPNAPCPPPSRRSSSGGRLSSVSITQVQQISQVENVGGTVPRGRASGPDPLSGLAAVHVDPSFEAATACVALLVRKRKDPVVEGRKDKEGSSSRSASKKACKGKEKEKDKERVPSMPLPGGILSPAFSMSDRTKFHMSSSQRALIEPLSKLELTNAMLKMSTRVASLAWYLMEFTDRPGVEEVCAELLVEKKNSSSLQSAMEQLLLNQDEYDKKIEQLEADLKKSKKETAEANDRLAIARGDHEWLLEECIQLKIKELFALGFDIEKEVFDGVLVDLNTVDDEEPRVEGPSGAAGAVEAGEAEAEEEEGVQMAVTLRKESFVNRPPRLTMVLEGTLRSSTWKFEARTAVVLRKELSVHHPAKLTVVP